MPGLLQSPDVHAAWKLGAAFVAEFLGVTLFALYGNAVPPEWGPWGNGLTLAVLIYITANVSGGHLNPAVTIATVITGHLRFLVGAAYVILQISGAAIGTLILVGLTPGNIYVGMGDSGPGCFAPKPNAAIDKGQAFGWEAIMTFVLVSTVYAVAVSKPNFSIIGPFAIGISLWASGFIASQYTGSALNPARVLGVTFVFHCYWGHAWVYVLGELLGGILAGLLAWPLYGSGPAWEGVPVIRDIENQLFSRVGSPEAHQTPASPLNPPPNTVSGGNNSGGAVK